MRLWQSLMGSYAFSVKNRGQSKIYRPACAGPPIASSRLNTQAFLDISSPLENCPPLSRSDFRVYSTYLCILPVCFGLEPGSAMIAFLGTLTAPAPPAAEIAGILAKSRGF